MALRKRFLRSTSGNVAMIFALVAVPSAMIVAAGVEITRVSSAKAKLDRATDAAALAAKKVQMENRDLGDAPAKAEGNDKGQKAFVQNSAELVLVADNSAVAFSWDPDESARAVGTADAKLLLGGLLGMNTVRITSTAVASSGSEAYYEIAMVLDNTGSMFEKDGRPKTRFTHLREASTSFVNAAFDNMGMPNRLRFSVIPFATTVNIKSEDTGGWDAAGGPAIVTADAGSRSMPSSTLNRNGEILENTPTLNAMFAPVGWRGCVSGNGESLSTNDAPKSGMKWNALAVPANLFPASWRPEVTINTTCTSCSPPPSGPPPPPGPPPSGPPPPPPPPKGKGKGKIGEIRPNAPLRQYANLNGAGQGASQSEARFLTFGMQTRKTQSCTTVPCTQQACDPAATPVNGAQCSQATYKYYGPDPNETGRRNAFVGATTNCYPSPGWCGPAQTTTLGACVADPNEINWNNLGGAWCSWVPTTSWTQFDDSIGPNVNCPMPMLGLSGSRPQVLSAINRMSPVVGGTHNDVGLRWGLRTLSPRVQWANFFGNNGSKAPVAFGSPSVRKALVLITDGENEEAEDFPGFWGCSDTVAPGCSGTPDQAELDSRMLSWCQSIRDNYNVDLYTVAVNITDPAAVAKLKTCAGSPARAFAVDASELNDTLAAVAGSIFALRLKE